MSDAKAADTGCSRFQEVLIFPCLRDVPLMGLDVPSR